LSVVADGVPVASKPCGFALKPVGGQGQITHTGSLGWVVGGGEPRCTRGQQDGHSDKDALSPIPNGQNGWLEGLRLAQ